MVEHLDVDQLERDRATILYSSSSPCWNRITPRLKYPTLPDICGLAAKICISTQKTRCILGQAKIGKSISSTKCQSDISFEVGKNSILQPLYERTYSNLQCYAQQKNSNNLIKSRHELYGKCNCKTRFLQLCAVGDVDADEA